jgi:hypothetical protein
MFFITTNCGLFYRKKNHWVLFGAKCWGTYLDLKNMKNYVLLTYILHGAVLLEKLTRSQLVKKFPSFYGTRRFITAFRNVHHLSLSRASSIQSIPPHPTFLRSILIQNILFPIDDFRFLFHRKLIIPRSYRALLSHLTSCTSTKSNLYLANSPATAVSDLDLHRILTFIVSINY